MAGLLVGPFGGGFNKAAALMTGFALLSIVAMALGRGTNQSRCTGGVSPIFAIVCQHIVVFSTPYPDTALFHRMEAQGRLLHRDWDLYDTRHVVFRPAGMEPAVLEAGYWRAYRDFLERLELLPTAGVGDVLYSAAH